MSKHNLPPLDSTPIAETPPPSKPLGGGEYIRGFQQTQMFLQKLDDITHRFELPHVIKTASTKKKRRSSIEDASTQNASIAALQSQISKSQLSGAFTAHG